MPTMMVTAAVTDAARIVFVSAIVTVATQTTSETAINCQMQLQLVV